MGANSAHFSDAELRCHHGINGCTQLLVDTLEEIRHKAGDIPVRVNDAYRCAVCNLALGNAARNSQHMLGNAADISVPGMTAAQLEEIARTIPAVHGIGRDDRQQYLHVDVRDTPTVSAWCYDDKGDQCPYYPPA